MVSRRAMGALEDEVMSYLWATMTPATTAEVHEAVAPDLAYTTVMTVLTRLWSKELLVRESKGRAFAYAAAQPEAEHRARQMQATLDGSGDRRAVLSSFVDSLEPRDATMLRRLLTPDP